MLGGPKRRYREEGLVGLATFHPGQPPKKLTPQLRAKILAKTQQAEMDRNTVVAAPQPVEHEAAVVRGVSKARHRPAGIGSGRGRHSRSLQHKV